MEFWEVALETKEMGTLGAAPTAAFIARWPARTHARTHESQCNRFQFSVSPSSAAEEESGAFYLKGLLVAFWSSRRVQSDLAIHCHCCIVHSCLAPGQQQQQQQHRIGCICFSNLIFKEKINS